MNVTMRNPKTGEVKEIKVGWSWTLFLFSNAYGLPLFLRKLTTWGNFMLIFIAIGNMITWVAPAIRVIDASVGILAWALGFAIFFGIKGNEMTAKNYLELGWEFCNPDSDEVKMAKTQWGINI